MTIEEMRKRKIELGYTNKTLSDESGVPVGTIQKIFSGETKAPRYMTIRALEAVLGAHDGLAANIARDGIVSGSRDYVPGSKDNVPGSRVNVSGSRDNVSGSKDKSGIGSPYGYNSYLKHSSAVPGMLQEGVIPYNTAQVGRKHTIEEYYALPGDVRVELIDGEFHDMGAPGKLHQGIMAELFLLFRECADLHDMPCEVWLSPCDIRLDRDDYTIVQPDLFVICSDHDPKAARFEGAPDLVVEIVSRSSVSRDKYMKLHKYHHAGVREYWIVDPDRRRVTVHMLEKEEDPQMYDFYDKNPYANLEPTKSSGVNTAFGE